MFAHSTGNHRASMGGQCKTERKFSIPYEYRRDDRILLFAGSDAVMPSHIQQRPISALTDRSACSSTRWQPIQPRFRRVIGAAESRGTSTGVLNAAAVFKIPERRIRRDLHRVLPDCLRY